MQRIKSPSPINKQTDLIRLSKMNGRLGDEDRKNVIISEGKNEERCYPKI